MVVRDLYLQSLLAMASSDSETDHWKPRLVQFPYDKNAMVRSGNLKEQRDRHLRVLIAFITEDMMNPHVFSVTFAVEN
jgi:hypothetical protein